ncbi:hypothetical protein JKY72_04655 [Candidatus Gracilibacteria bacterium]|nr:hypothetical protein [Candidatus Gracilibacteria bacterium]
MENAAFVEGIARSEREMLARLHKDVKLYGQWIEGKGEEDHETPEEGIRSFRSESILDDYSQFFKVVSNVAEDFAIKYFKALGEYLELKESGDGEIDVVRGKVVAFADLTLRQIKGSMREGKFDKAKTSSWEQPSFKKHLDNLVDSNRLDEQSEFPGLFEDRGNHFGFSADGESNLFCTHTAYEGLMPMNLLRGLDPNADVQIRWGDQPTGKLKGDGHLVAILRKDGTLDIL